MADPPRHAFCLAVVSEPDAMSAGQLARLVELLVARRRGTHRVVLLAPAGGPQLQWCQSLGWSLHLAPGADNPVRRDCELVASADAILVVGPRRPWERLIRLAGEARIPVRVYAECPRLPPAPPEPWERSQGG